MNKEYSISVITPVYNEVGLLESSISYIDTFLAQHFKEYEILLVESGSTDGSAEICDELANKLPNLKLIHEGGRNGFGSALKLGYKNVTKDLVWLITVDLPFPLEAIQSALPLLSKYDCVLSYRSQDDRTTFRKIQSFIYNTLVKTVLGLRVKHVNSAFKVFKRQIVQNITLQSKGWLLDAETLYQIKQHKVSYIEIPVELIDRKFGNSSIKLSTGISVLKELLHLVRTKEKY